eukprot:6505289-Prymnesium_polylepis.1
MGMVACARGVARAHALIDDEEGSHGVTWGHVGSCARGVARAHALIDDEEGDDDHVTGDEEADDECEQRRVL